MKHHSLLMLIVITSLFNCNSHSEMKTDTTPVQQFDLDRYLGTWYEIARYPHSFEKDLVGVTATYSLRDDGKVKVVNKGFVDSLSGDLKTITGKAKLAGDPNVGYLKVSFFLFFYADYKILELDTANYHYALVGSSSDKYLWILGRSPMMTDSTYNMLLEEARRRGYALDRLQKVEQKPLKEFVPGETI